MRLRGHEPAWHAWRTALESERMHHAWLLAGPRGLGKATFARAAAAELVADPDTHQPTPEAHPDILALEPVPDGEEEVRKRESGKPFRTKRNIAIDQIRRMQARLTTRGTLGERRAVIIDPADYLEKGAANALLKSLEEPPVGTFFLLVAHRPGRLLPTIRSRCRLLRFAPLSDEDVDAVLRQVEPAPDLTSRTAALAAAQGSPGVALDFLIRDLGAAHVAIQRLLSDGDQDFAGRGALVQAVGARPDRDRILAFVDLAGSSLAALLRDASSERQARIIEAHGEIARLARQAPTFNFDPGLLVTEIGGLLASAAMATALPNRA